MKRIIINYDRVVFDEITRHSFYAEVEIFQLTVVLVLSILLCGVATLTSFAANDNQSDSESEIEELQPVTANPCKVPQHAYSMYSYLSNGGDPDIYIHHMYENTSYPRLPSRTTYTTYYVDNDPQKN